MVPDSTCVVDTGFVIAAVPFPGRRVTYGSCEDPLQRSHPHLLTPWHAWFPPLLCPTRTPTLPASPSPLPPSHDPFQRRPGSRPSSGTRPPATAVPCSPCPEIRAPRGAWGMALAKQGRPGAGGGNSGVPRPLSRCPPASSWCWHHPQRKRTLDRGKAHCKGTGNTHPNPDPDRPPNPRPPIPATRSELAAWTFSLDVTFGRGGGELGELGKPYKCN